MPLRRLETAAQREWRLLKAEEAIAGRNEEVCKYWLEAVLDFEESYGISYDDVVA